MPRQGHRWASSPKPLRVYFPCDTEAQPDVGQPSLQLELTREMCKATEHPLGARPRRGSIHSAASLLHLASQPRGTQTRPGWSACPGICMHRPCLWHLLKPLPEPGHETTSRRWGPPGHAPVTAGRVSQAT